MNSEFIRWIRLRWKSLFQPSLKEQELAREMQFHLDQLIEENIAAGMNPQQARLSAQKEFGGIDQYAEAARDTWRPSFLADILPDLRFSLRYLAKSAGFTTVVILTLAISIGATTAIFSIVNSVALQPMPYADADQLVEIRQVRESDQREFSPRWETVEEIQQQTTAFASVTASTGMHGNLTGVDYPVRVFGYSVALNYFSTLGVQPLIGRTFLPEEIIEGKANVVILNHAFWLAQFNGSDSVLDQKVLLNDEPYTIIGVMPPGFRTLTGQLSSPKAFAPLAPNNVTDSVSFLREVVGRLKPGATLEQAQAELDVLATRLEVSNPDMWGDLKLRIEPLLDYHVGDTRPTLYLLLGAVGFLLLIACVNVANLLLARASSRQREIALRAALGASRTRVVRQLLAESILLALVGGALGILLAFWGMNALLSFAPINMPRLDEVQIDGFALLFSCAVTMITGIGFGLVPALQATKVDLTIALKDGGRSSGDGRQRARLRNTLVIAEVALALILLIGAGLLTRTFANLQNVEMGYDGDVVHTTRIMMLEDKYPDDQSRITFTDRALEQLAQEPDLVASAFTMGLPHFGHLGYRIDFEDHSEADANRLSQVGVSTITPDFFEVMSTPLIKGRLFNERDRENSPLVAIIGESVSEQFFPDENPLGQRIALVRTGPARAWLEIVGVVPDILVSGANQDTSLGVYVPFCQHVTFSHIKPVVKIRPGGRNPGPIVAAALQRVDPAMPIERDMPNLGAFDGYIIAPQKFTLFIFGVFSFVALLLAALGIYGVMAYTVSQRTNEIGVRMALGAQPGDILRLMLGHAGKLVGIGLIIGILGSIAGSRLLTNILYEVSPYDPMTFVSVSLVLSAVGLLACYIPSRRATKVDPVIALRSE